MLTLCADHHLIFHVSHIFISTPPTPCYVSMDIPQPVSFPYYSPLIPMSHSGTACHSLSTPPCDICVAFDHFPASVKLPFLPVSPPPQHPHPHASTHACTYTTYTYTHTHTHIFTHVYTHTHTHTQLCTQWAHSMVTFGWLLTVTMDREQWSSTIVDLDGLAFAQTTAGVLVMPRWPADSWDMRLGGQ